MTAFLGLSPVTAVILSVLFLGATPTLTLAVAMVLVVGSLAATAFAQRRGRKMPPLPAGGGGG